MKIYLVRHGETEDNSKSIYMPPQAALSKIGIKQTKTLANRFASLPVDLIISSPFKRAKQTAMAIHFVVDKKVILDENLKEIVRPSDFIGLGINDLHPIKVKKLFELNQDDPSWHYSDEENFFDVKKRAEKFLQSLDKFKEGKIVVVTHAFFMKLLLSVMLFEEKLTPEIFFKLYNFLDIQNTGITVCEKNQDGKWQLVTWNDHAHLG